MPTYRTHIVLPQDLVAEIDAAVGPRGRSAFLVETARNELRRRKLLALLDAPEPAWRAQDHPELGKGATAWVRAIRSESDRRASPGTSPGKRTK